MKIQLVVTVSKTQLSYVARNVRVLLALVATCLAGSAGAALPDSITLGGHEAHPTRILAQFKETVVAAASGSALEQLGSKIVWQSRLVPGLVVLGDASVSAAAQGAAPSEEVVRAQLLNRMNALALSGMFKYVEPDYTVHLNLTPNDQSFVDGTLWGLQNLGQKGGVPGVDIDAVRAWDLTTGSTNVIVAVIDTGIRYTHNDLTSQMWINPGEIPGNGIDDDGNGYVDDIYGINAITDTGDPMDLGDHGTHVSGTIGASANDEYRLVGVAWNVRLMGCRFLGSNGGSTSDGIKCIDYAVTMGARILNNSWGGGGYSQALYDIIAVAGQRGVLFVAAAGNDGLNNDLIPAYPASYPLDNIVSVAAIDRYNLLADFSNYGQTSVDLGAPGVAIYSSVSTSDSAYQLMNGTSMATPHVSGVAALILSIYPAADLNEMVGRLFAGVVPVPGLNGRTTTGGRVNAYNSLTVSGSGTLRMTVNPASRSYLLSGSEQPIFVRVTDLFGVNTATVNGEVAGLTNLVFANDGVPPDAIANDDIYSAILQVPEIEGTLTMTLTATATNKLGITNAVNYAILPPPPNDYFTNATKVPAAGGTYFANNRFATLEDGEPHHASVDTAVGSLWWSYTPTVTTNVFIDTTGSTIDTVLAIYTGTTVSNLHLVVATNDVGNRREAYLGLPVQAGTGYRIAVASASADSLGSIQLRIAPGGGRDVTPPAVFVASPLSGLSVSNQLIMVTGTAADPTPNASGVSEVFLSVNGNIAATALGTTNWSAPALLQPGVNTLKVTSVDAAGNYSASVTRQVHYLPNNPVNDIFANALPLVATPEFVTVANTNATKEAGEPHHAGNAGGKSVWWLYQPPADGVLVLNTTNSTFDTLLAVYTGSTVGNLTEIASNDDAYEGIPGGFSQIVQAVRASSLYYIAVDGYDGVSGQVVLNYSFTPAPVFRLTVEANGDGTVAPGSGDYASNTVIWLTASPSASHQFSSWAGDVTSSANPVAVVMNGDKTVTVNFELIPFADGFESGDFQQLPWTTSGEVPWVITEQSVASGQFAARSGEMVDNNQGFQTSSLTLTVALQDGSGSFAYRVSSEPTFDYLRFSLDGEELQRWSGETDWTTFMFPVQKGTHTLQWDYVKDAALSIGLDAAFIDNLLLPLGLPVDESTPASLEIIRLPDGSLTIEILGQEDREYEIQASSNLTDWELVATQVASGGVIHFTDPNSGMHSVRFYRAVAVVP